MVATVYAPEMSVLDARAAYFEANSFGVNGGYDEGWVEFELGPFTFWFPNTASRLAAVRVHDLHHIVTGYETDAAGEFEISGWEIGAGCGSFAAAWVLNLTGLASGALLWPRRTFRAFVRGRRTRSLYGRPLEDLLGTTVAGLREVVGVDRRGVDAPATLSDLASFVVAAIVGAVVGLVFFALALPLMPFGFLALSAARRRAAAERAR